MLWQADWSKATETELFTDKQQALCGSAAQYILGRCEVTVALLCLNTSVGVQEWNQRTQHETEQVWLADIHGSYF